MRNQVESGRRGRPGGVRGAIGRASACALVAIGLVGTAAAPPRAVAVEDVRVGLDGRYKVGTWTMVSVLLRGGPDGFAGEMQTVTNDENGTPTAVHQAVQVAPGGTQRVVAYVRPGSLDPDFATIHFLDGRTGREAAPEFVVGSAATAADSRTRVDPLGQGDYQLVALGHPQGVELIPKLPGYNANAQNAATNSRAREVAVAQVDAMGAFDRLPGRWYGYDSADAVVIDTGDAEAMAAIDGGRVEAIGRWVERGGHLVVAVSSRWQAVNDSPLAAMLPAKVVGQVQVTPFDSLESFTGGTHQVGFEDEAVRAARLEEVEARGGQVVASTLSTPLVVRGPYGFGRVTLVGLDVDAKPFAGWGDRALFWTKSLDLKAPPGATVEAAAASQRLVGQNVSDLATILRRSLDQFAGMTVIPFGWVAGFIALYILLIGPGDYFFLKKVLKRMELTWITFPTIVVTVSLLAYYAAYKIKGTDLRVNQVDVVDVDLPNRIARGTTWLNLFSPQNRDYTVAVRPVPVAPDASASSPPSAGAETILSWFAAPENGLMGMNSRGRGVGFAGSGYSYEPPGQAERLEGVRIGIWSTKGVLARWFAPAPRADGLVDVDLQPVGTDRLAGTVTNRLDIPLKNAMIAFGKQVYYKLGTIEPGATVEVDATTPRVLGNQLQQDRPSFMPTTAYSLGNEGIDRANLVREMMFQDSDASGQVVVSSRTHRELDLTGQLLLGRPMLYAEVDRPGAVLELADAPGAVKIDRTTMLRVILPLRPDAPAPAAVPASPTEPKGPRP